MKLEETLKEDKELKIVIIILAIFSMIGAAGVTFYSTYKIAYYLIAAFAYAFTIEFLLRYFNSRTVSKQILQEFL